MGLSEFVGSLLYPNDVKHTPALLYKHAAQYTTVYRALESNLVMSTAQKSLEKSYGLVVNFLLTIPQITPPIQARIKDTREFFIHPRINPYFCCRKMLVGWQPRTNRKNAGNRDSSLIIKVLEESSLMSEPGAWITKKPQFNP